MNLKIISLLMVFVDRKMFQGLHRKNGVVESMNKTIVEHARSIRLCAGFPLNMWEKVVNTTIILHKM